MKNQLSKVLFNALESLQEDGTWPKVSSDLQKLDVSVEYPPLESYGDFSTSVALSLAKYVKKSPVAIAHDIAVRVGSSWEYEVEVIAPGYVNFRLSDAYLHGVLRTIDHEGTHFGQSNKGSGKKVLVECLSANPTGPIHIGNSRGGVVGDVIARVLEKAGYAVEREYYVNDAGNQIRVLGHSILKDSEAQYRGEYIDALSKDCPKNLTNPMDVGEWGANRVLETLIKPTCESAGIYYDRYFSERSLHAKKAPEHIIELLREKDLVFEKGGALWYRATELGDEKDRVLLTSDARVSYRLADFAYHQDKLSRGYEKLINVLGADHHSEAQEMVAFVERVLGRRGVLDVVLTQFVRVMQGGKEVKMSKRRGTYFSLDDLISEVGRDAVRFFFLANSVNSQIRFDIDVAREQSEKNPVYSVQYAHARIASMLQKAEELDLLADYSKLDMLTDPKELALMREIRKFGEIIETLSESYDIHLLPRYAMGLADKLHSFYAECKVVDPDASEVSRARLALVRSVKIVLAETLRLVGVSAPEKM